MSSFDILSRDGHHRIESVVDWGIRCRPQSDKHWKDGFSAKECAKAWFRHTQPSVPAELHALFELHPLTKGFAVREVMPELQTRLDTFGKGRCHDLILRGKTATSHILVGVEAKVSESYGNRIGRVYDRSRAMPDSGGWRRIDQLLHGLFGHPLDEQTRALRYQLLHGVAGTLIQATLERPPSDLAVFVVHEFVRDRRRAQANHGDLAAFISALTGLSAAAVSEAPFLLGPFTVPGSDRIPADVPFLLGKVSVPLAGTPDVEDAPLRSEAEHFQAGQSRRYRSQIRVAGAIKETTMSKTWSPDDPLTPTQQTIVDKLRKGYTLARGKGLAVMLKGNGLGPDEKTTMRSVNGIIKRGIINEALQLTKQKPL